MYKPSQKPTSKVLELIFLSFLIVFNINNFIKYSPYWGFDGPGHIYLIRYISEFWSFPKEMVYGVSNPPLYYFLAAVLLKIFNNIKIVQLFSLILYFIDLYLLSKCINVLSKNTILNYSVLCFFALLPLNLHYAYMIFNYPLGHFFAILIIYLMIDSFLKESLSKKQIVLISLLTILSILTSLTNLIFLPLLIIYLVLFPYLNLKHKLSAILIVAFVNALFLYPYYVYKVNSYGNFLHITHRTKNKVNISELYKTYPLKFYYNFDLNSFNLPYAPNYMKDGMWILLHQTLYSDYFNYQVDSKHSSDTIPTKGLINTGQHYIDKDKAMKFTGLNYMGIPISFFFLIVILSSLKNSFLFILDQKKTEYFLDLISLTAILLFFVQFLVYILQYPSYVNISSGYIFPAIFILCINLAIKFKSNLVQNIISLCLFMFSIMSYYTFFRSY
jgi:hypothetical protein